MFSTLALVAFLPAFIAVQAIPTSDTAATTPLAVLSYVPYKTDSDGRISLPEGAANGFYSQHNSTVFAYHGTAANANTFTKSEAGQLVKPTGYSYDGDSVKTVVESREVVKRQNACDVSCSGKSTYDSDFNNAVSGFQNMVGGGRSFQGTIAYVQGQAYAFGCDYGKGQTVSADLYSADITCVRDRCGPSQSGWNSHHKWKSTYGVAIGGYNC